MILDVDPKVDYAFKHLFGRDVTRPILMNLLDMRPEPAAGPSHPRHRAAQSLQSEGIAGRQAVHPGHQGARPERPAIQRRNADAGVSPLCQADSLLRLQAASATTSRGPGLPRVEADHFNQLLESCLVSGGADLSSVFSLVGAGAPSDLDGRPGVSRSGIAEVHEVGRAS